MKIKFKIFWNLTYFNSLIFSDISSLTDDLFGWDKWWMRRHFSFDLDIKLKMKKWRNKWKWFFRYVAFQRFFEFWWLLSSKLRLLKTNFWKLSKHWILNNRFGLRIALFDWNVWTENLNNLSIILLKRQYWKNMKN